MPTATTADELGTEPWTKIWFREVNLSSGERPSSKGKSQADKLRMTGLVSQLKMMMFIG